MKIPVSTDKEEFWHHVETTPQAQIDQAYTQLLEARIHRNKTTMLTALMYCSIGALDRAQQALSQGINDL